MPLPPRQEVLDKVTRHVISQIKSPESLKELKTLGPAGFDWVEPVLHNAKTVLPRLVDIAPDIASACTRPFNNPIEISEKLDSETLIRIVELASTLDPLLAAEAQKLMSSCKELVKAGILTISRIESQQISAEIQRILVSDEVLGVLLHMNGGSIYPDLVPSGFDYSFLPYQSRTGAIHGPCLRDRTRPKPSNVPNGIEIKTNKSTRIRVDAHGAHPGLHLGITWGVVNCKIKVHDFWIAYIRLADYTFSDGTVDVTTKKRSFGHAPFISMISGSRLISCVY